MSYTKMIRPNGESAGVRRDADRACIPEDPRNSDWRAYQEWLAAGNVPAPAPPPAPAAARPKPPPDAHAVLASLGLTPEQIETAIKRAGG